MSKITSPILLDSTGQDINYTLQGIHDTLRAANTLIDDFNTSPSTVWSSQKIVNTLTQKETQQGSSIVCAPIAATPIIVQGDVEIGTLELTHSNGTTSNTYSIYIPAAGHFNWATGILTLVGGETAALVSKPLVALEGTNTISISSGTFEATYRVLGQSDGTAPNWSIIHGGSAAEEV